MHSRQGTGTVIVQSLPNCFTCSLAPGWCAHTRVILPGPTCSYQPVNPDGMASLTRDPALIFGVRT